MWSFVDTLFPKLELETSREITALTYCPYDGNVIVGGTINGQIMIWDMRNRLLKVETEEILTPNQIRFRSAMWSFLDWTKQDNQDRIVRPVALSALQFSHKAAVTGFQWIDKKYFITTTGIIRENINGNNRYFVTFSVDCTIAFWNLDFFDEVEARKPSAAKKIKLPDHLQQEKSDYEHLNRVFRPQLIIVYNRPITSIVFDQAIYKYKDIHLLFFFDYKI